MPEKLRKEMTLKKNHAGERSERVRNSKLRVWQNFRTYLCLKSHNQFNSDYPRASSGLRFPVPAWKIPKQNKDSSHSLDYTTLSPQYFLLLFLQS